MAGSRYALGLVALTRCALVLKGYFNTPTLKAAFKIRAGIHGLKDLLVKKKTTSLSTGTSTSLNTAAYVAAISTINPVGFQLMSERLHHPSKIAAGALLQHTLPGDSLKATGKASPTASQGSFSPIGW